MKAECIHSPIFPITDVKSHYLHFLSQGSSIAVNTGLLPERLRAHAYTVVEHRVSQPGHGGQCGPEGHPTQYGMVGCSIPGLSPRDASSLPFSVMTTSYVPRLWQDAPCDSLGDGPCPGRAPLAEHSVYFASQGRNRTHSSSIALGAQQLPKHTASLALSSTWGARSCPRREPNCVCGGSPWLPEATTLAVFLQIFCTPLDAEAQACIPTASPTQLKFHTSQRLSPLFRFPLLFPRTQQWKARSRVNPLLTRRQIIALFGVVWIYTPSKKNWRNILRLDRMKIHWRSSELLKPETVRGGQELWDF